MSAGIRVPHGDAAAVDGAARALARAAEAFQRSSATIDRAQRSVPSWRGEAARVFGGKIASYGDGARLAADASAHAQQALARYATNLADAQRRIIGLATRAEGCLAQARTAEAAAREASKRGAAATLLSVVSPASHADAERARNDELHARGAADRAQHEFASLQREATRVEDELHDHARAAVNALEAAIGSLPGVHPARPSVLGTGASALWHGLSVGGSLSSSYSRRRKLKRSPSGQWWTGPRTTKESKTIAGVSVSLQVARERRAAFLDRSFHSSHGALSSTASVLGGARAGVVAGGRLDKSGAHFSAEGEQFAGGEGTTGAQFGGNRANVGARASAMAGVKASESVGIDISRGGVGAAAGGDVFAGVRAEGDVYAKLSGVSAKATGDVGAGLGADAHASAHISWTKIHVKAKLGVYVGIGGRVGVDTDVNPSEIVSDVLHVGHHR